MKRVLTAVLCIGLSCMAVLPLTVQAEEETEFTILYTNDVHCAIDGYAPFGGYKAELESQGKTVLAVDAGDCIQGDLIGTYTQGEAITELMNEVPYDLAIPGNHEFDYNMEQLFQLTKKNAEFPYICCNFLDKDKKTVFDPYQIMDVQGYQVGFVGIVTPETVVKSTPKFFQDENGEFIYFFSEDSFYQTIQNAVDDCRNAGAEIVIAIGHIGMKGIGEGHRTSDIIENTRGINAFIDGHSHEVYEGPDYNGTVYQNLDGEVVPMTQTGTKFAHYGEMKVTLSGHGENISVNIETKLLEPETTELSTEEGNAKAEAINMLIQKEHDLVAKIASEPAGKSEVKLASYVEGTTDWLVRSQETSLGDYVADAYRWKTGAEIGIVNSGGCRADINEGDLTVGDLVKVNPWVEEICVISASGQTIADALEMGARLLPDSNGGLLQVSGLTFTIDTSVETPVITDDIMEMKGIDASKPRRVSDIKVNGEPIDMQRMYTVASTVYVLQDGGDGQTGFRSCQTLSTDFPPDAEILVQYLKEALNGTITEEQYGNLDGDGRMKIVSGETETGTEAEPKTSAELPVWQKLLVLFAGIALGWLLVKEPKQKKQA